MVHQEVEIATLKFYDAVLANDPHEVLDLLKKNSTSENKISIKIITGLLLIAIENRLIESAKAILKYNSISDEPIKSCHLDSILCVAAKHNLLKKLDITYH